MFCLLLNKKNMNSSSNKIQEFSEESIKYGDTLSIIISNTCIKLVVQLLFCTQTLLDSSHWTACNYKNGT